MPWVFLWKNFESVQNIQTSQFHVSQKSDGLSWFLFAGVLQGQNEGVGQPDLLLEALEEHLMYDWRSHFLAGCQSRSSASKGNGIPCHVTSHLCSSRGARSSAYTLNLSDFLFYYQLDKLLCFKGSCDKKKVHLHNLCTLRSTVPYQRTVMGVIAHRSHRFQGLECSIFGRPV